MHFSVTKLEKEIQKEIIAFLNRKNIYNIKTITSNKAGIPDLIVCHEGLFYGFEVKRPKGRQNDIQKYQEQKIKQSGGKYFVVHNVEGVKEALRL